MIVSHLRLKNWRNFQAVDVALKSRVFLVGPNASGKSNLLDVFRFLRDIVKRGGGLQQAIEERGGLSKIRCLAARSQPDVEIEVTLAEAGGQSCSWKYAIGIKQQHGGTRQPVLVYERIWNSDGQILNRPNESDTNDPMRLTQTHLEQISANERFRDLSKFFESVLYQHLVPQLVRYPRAFTGPGVPGDPFGRSFLERVARTPDKTRKSRLRRIEQALKIAVPQLKDLTEVKDEAGIPHLEVVYAHWRPMGAKQREDQFSDGTLRLIALLWSLLDGEGLLLLEEPELSLNAGIIRALPSIIYRLQRKQKRQVVVSTHSLDLLSDNGIGGEEVLLLTPTAEGTKVQVVSGIQEVRDLLEGGLTIADAVMPRTEPQAGQQLLLFDA
jgi:predicted ATPase